MGLGWSGGASIRVGGAVAAGLTMGVLSMSRLGSKGWLRRWGWRSRWALVVGAGAAAVAAHGQALSFPLDLVWRAAAGLLT